MSVTTSAKLGQMVKDDMQAYNNGYGMIVRDYKEGKLTKEQRDRLIGKLKAKYADKLGRVGSQLAQLEMTASKSV